MKIRINIVLQNVFARLRSRYISLFTKYMVILDRDAADNIYTNSNFLYTYTCLNVSLCMKWQNSKFCEVYYLMHQSCCYKWAINEGCSTYLSHIN